MRGLYLGRGDLLGDRAETGLKLALELRAGPELLGDLVAAPLAQHGRLERSGALAGRVAGVGDGLAEPAQRPHELLALGDAGSKRLLAALVERALDAAGLRRDGVSGLPDLADVLRP